MRNIAIRGFLHTQDRIHSSRKEYLQHSRTYCSTEGASGSLSSFLTDFEMAKSGIGTCRLPLSETAYFKFDKLNGITWINGDDYKVRLCEASGGCQAALPLCLVSKYLSDMVATRESALSVEEKLRLYKEVEEIMEKDVSEAVRDALQENLSKRYGCTSLLNIVEEPELNLSPENQKCIMYFLISVNNRDSGKQAHYDDTQPLRPEFSLPGISGGNNIFKEYWQKGCYRRHQCHCPNRVSHYAWRSKSLPVRLGRHCIPFG